ncbi:SDR family NAD(P)-dependent oxidoreductase [Phaeobacter sp. QD34_3]|uniref:SDR family NAD(P)-dependent oxidoreductase n=1 Tax=unclassified Phaeobacter TaxID=2621772 RepID=UPI00237F3CB8|nr:MULTISPECIES: SDR family NAD(P)-dependent oxidoreductase [unclassified Phaeobacter]MDE4132781.1 SDR family NAD(P)-dependent oxidoreductase [Phaeobacter sp. QD34_3]MDE4136426.1 SDR family NAD(P)-dependent oxidoreductase [Phaeobacter sp. QD34_24]
MKTAIISGGAGGLGRALSAALQDRSWRVILLDLDTSGLETSETQIPIQCDLTDGEQLRQVSEQILQQYPVIDLVIYNAGITQIGGFDTIDEASHRRVFEINYFAAVAMAGHFLQAVRRAGGTHIAISSVAGFTPLFHRTSYAASKHALEGFFKSLRSEEKPHAVDVLIAAPSFVATNIGNDQRQSDGTARPGSASDGVDYMTPEAAARDILRGYDRRQPMIPVGRVARLAWWINSLAPRLYQRLMERQIGGHDS